MARKFSQEEIHTVEVWIRELEYEAEVEQAKGNCCLLRMIDLNQKQGFLKELVRIKRGENREEADASKERQKLEAIERKRDLKAAQKAAAEQKKKDARKKYNAEKKREERARRKNDEAYKAKVAKWSATYLKSRKDKKDPIKIEAAAKKDRKTKLQERLLKAARGDN